MEKEFPGGSEELSVSSPFGVGGRLGRHSRPSGFLFFPFLNSAFVSIFSFFNYKKIGFRDKNLSLLLSCTVRSWDGQADRSGLVSISGPRSCEGLAPIDGPRSDLKED